MSCNVCHGKSSARFWIECESCKQWFHIRCVGIRSQKEAKQLDQWLCRRCQNRTDLKDVATETDNFDEPCTFVVGTSQPCTFVVNCVCCNKTSERSARSCAQCNQWYHTHCIRLFGNKDTVLCPSCWTFPAAVDEETQTEENTSCWISTSVVDEETQTEENTSSTTSAVDQETQTENVNCPLQEQFSSSVLHTSVEKQKEVKTDKTAHQANREQQMKYNKMKATSMKSSHGKKSLSLRNKIKVLCESKKNTPCQDVDADYDSDDDFQRKK